MPRQTQKKTGWRRNQRSCPFRGPLDFLKASSTVVFPRLSKRRLTKARYSSALGIGGAPMAGPLTTIGRSTNQQPTLNQPQTNRKPMAPRALSRGLKIPFGQCPRPCGHVARLRGTAAAKAVWWRSFTPRRLGLRMGGAGVILRFLGGDADESPCPYGLGPPARCPFSATFFVGRVPLLK